MKQHKVLVANRGEIALRVIRTCKAMGLKTVAVYSEPDIESLHVRFADEAYCLGPAPSSESYLNIDKILASCKDAGVTMIHPGYGFLSENAAFADACAKHNLIFVGPSSQVMTQMGDKIQARIAAKKAKLPLIEGSEDLKDAKQALNVAQEVGFPILLKAKAGGGGKGMRLVNTEKDLNSAFDMAQSEAQKAFGNGTLYIEKYLDKPRHIEVQVFGLSTGETLIFGLRDCSVQRRHQKIVEEAGQLGLKNQTQEKLHSMAKELCQSLNYQGAGTLEFLVDAQENIYFLEMNTRLQVEHPVTEWIYGVDLVRMQILNALQMDQNLHVPPARGHAIEVRIYAEKPTQNFLPSPGTIDFIQWPSGANVRVDSAIESGHSITSFYDPMIAKISCYGQNRDHCIQQSLIALSELKISGIDSNTQFLKQILMHPDFVANKVHTQFINESLMQNFGQNTWTASSVDLALSAVVSCQTQQDLKMPAADNEVAHSSWWQSGLETP
ncbi:MAG TPA: biotin carboxylase N-terminal domain-containing protein [Oligoflexia bacterium]|nr:biotin carboxylase N-terminal domain-containing protein [Oligoflexia bacterium]